jgi:hypothetical protein
MPNTVGLSGPDKGLNVRDYNTNITQYLTVQFSHNHKDENKGFQYQVYL